MSEHNKAIVVRWAEELWNRGDFSAAHEFVSADVQYRGNQMPPADGLKALQDTVLQVRAGFPNGRFTIDELVAEGQTVVQRWTFRGTHTGTWAGLAATGRQVELTGTTTFHLKDGKIAKHHADWDALRMMEQLGAVKR